MSRRLFRPLSMFVPVGVIACSLTSASAAAAQTDAWRDLTPWIVDAVKITRGLPSELNWEASNAPAFDEVVALINARPVLSGPENTYETEHFLIHYTYEGADAATDDQVAWSAEALEYSWNREINELGYPEPPSDGSKGGDARYDVYWTKQVGTYGFCSLDSFVDENSATSYLALATWMNEVETQVTVAHEFFHALHFTMDALEEAWWFEVTATWMEDQVYDDINDYYNYLPYVFDDPETPINAETSIMYGYAIWGHSLSEKFGVDVVRDIWFDCSDSAAPSALATNVAVINRSGNWNAVLHNFRESLFDLSRFSEGDGYALAIGSDGAPGEVSFTRSVTKYPYDGSGTLEVTGDNLIELQATGDGPGDLEITYSGGAALVASLLVQSSDGTISEYVSDTDTGSGATFTVPDFGGSYTRAVMVVTNTSVTDSSSFTYSVSVPEWEGGGGCAHSPAPSSHRSEAGLLGLVTLTAGLIALRRRNG